MKNGESAGRMPSKSLGRELPVTYVTYLGRKCPSLGSHRGCLAVIMYKEAEDDILPEDQVHLGPVHERPNASVDGPHLKSYIVVH